ncbi:MAG: hypothetical protein PHX59_10065 [Sulfuricurvum sp.]|nr:hypothetical protein [Sulfuricurvum sp.]
MKKVLIGIVLIFGVLMAAKQLMHKDYTSAKQLADAGNYQAFYTEIKKDINKGDKNTIDLVVSYLHKAIDEGDIAEAKYYLENDSNLISEKDELGLYPIDIAVFFTKRNQIDMIKMLLEFHPNLNYRMTAPENITLTENFFLYSSQIDHSADILKLLTDNGMDINNYGNPSKDDICIPPLVRSYLNSNFELFNFLLQKTKNLNPLMRNKDEHATLIEKIVFSYIAEIEKQGSKLEYPTNEQLWSVIRSEKYRALHQKNIQYVKALLDHGLIDQASEKELRKLFVFYAGMGEMDGTKLFIDHGICTKYPNLCMQAKQIAHNNHFTEIEKLLQGK